MRSISMRSALLAITGVAAIMVSLLAWSRAGSAAPAARTDSPREQIECKSKAPLVDAAANPGIHGTSVAFNSNPNHWDPTPLLAVKVTLGGRSTSCLVAHFSAMAQPQDNWVVFQVRVDGVAMQGHAAGLGGVVEPAVFDPDESNAIGPFRMVAHDFFSSLKPGSHLVEVLFAGCCSGNPNGSGAAVENPVITLEHG